MRQNHTSPVSRQCLTSKWATAILLFSAMVIASQAALLSETPLAGDYDGDGICDPTIYIRSLGSLQTLLSSLAYGSASIPLDTAALTPLAGDFDGDGKTDPTVYQDNTGLWIVNLSGLGYAPVYTTLGGTDYTAVPDDFDGDGKTDPAVYQNNTGLWIVTLSGLGYATVYMTLGGAGYAAVPGDFDGDGKTDPTVYQNNTGLWIVTLSGLGYAQVRTTLGGAGYTAVSGDYDGDGKADPGAYQEATRSLTVQLSANNYTPASMSFNYAPPAILPALGRVLILYDSTGIYGWWGVLHQQLLANLLSHFKVAYISQPVEQYSVGDLDGFTATFYIGSIYNNSLNAAFCQDILNTTNTVCWLGFNLWQIAWDSSESDNPAFVEKFGFQFEGEEPGFTYLRYKEKILPFRDPDSTLGVISIVDSNRASPQVIAYDATDSNLCPYITRASNLWYVADNPLDFVTMADRSLAFADILHDILGIPHAESHRAFIRIEDVNPLSSPTLLTDIALYLQEQQIAYTVSVIPEYRDPLGVENRGVPRIVTLDDSPNLLAVVSYMAAHGGQIVQHGYTHQYDSVPNPIGNTGSDYEFYRVISGNGENVMVGPVLEDSAAWAGQRVLSGQSILSSHGLAPIAWLTPHYLASATDYSVFPVLFPLALDRGVYFASDTDGATHAMENLAPFMIPRDVYGQKRVPETIGYISPDEGFFPSDLIARADANLVVRDGWAGCYYHWFLGTNYLPELIAGVTNLGYKFTTINPGLE